MYTWQEPWGSILPGVDTEEIQEDPPAVCCTYLDDLRVRPKGYKDAMLEQEFVPFVPRGRSLRPATKESRFLWFPAARVLAYLWSPAHRLTLSHPTSHHIEPRSADASTSRPRGQSRVVFIVGSPNSGKKELLREAYDCLPATYSDRPQRWMPAVDIIIMPENDGLSLRSLWTPVSAPFATLASRLPCNNEELMGEIHLPHGGQIPIVSFFQRWAARWRTKHKRNTYHPQFLVQNLHLISLEHQQMLLDMVLPPPGLAPSPETPPLFVTITSLPTATIASKLAGPPDLGVYYIGLDAMQADPALLERQLAQIRSTRDASSVALPSHKLSKLARILSYSPSPHYHLKMLSCSWGIRHETSRTVPIGQQREVTTWEGNLEDILAAPEPEAWRLIDEYLLEEPYGDEGDVGDCSEGLDYDDERDSDASD